MRGTSLSPARLILKRALQRRRLLGGTSAIEHKGVDLLDSPERLAQRARGQQIPIAEAAFAVDHRDFEIRAPVARCCRPSSETITLTPGIEQESGGSHPLSTYRHRLAGAPAQQQGLIADHIRVAIGLHAQRA